MTYEEALTIIHGNLQVAIHDIEGLNEDYEKEQVVALTLAKESLEKQVPQKAVDFEYPWFRCPECGGCNNIESLNIEEHIQNNETTYCVHCGQAIDWSDSDD